jgi:adenine deaminase
MGCIIAAQQALDTEHCFGSSSLMQTTSQNLEMIITQAAGRVPADLVIKGGRFFDLVTGQLIASDIAICGDRIIGTNSDYQGTTEIDATGQIIVPGFIDTHLHVESSLVTPAEFDRCVLPHGVTTAICDPHEIANVLGKPGIQYFLDCAQHTIMDLRVQLSSCVPATHMETAGAAVSLADLKDLMHHPKVLGLAEFMNFPGVISGDAECLAKLALFAGGHIDGHAPLVRGKNLNAYLASGIRTDHETTTAEEALEKLSKGMQILIREGSVSKDLHALIPIITEMHSAYIALCTDDRNPLDIAEEGHLDFMIRTAIANGASPLAIYRAASISAARIFRLHDRGLVAPGYRADLVMIDSLENCNVSNVISAGRLVTQKLFDACKPPAPIGRASVKIREIISSNFIKSGSGKNTPVIGVMPGKIITNYLHYDLPSQAGHITLDLKADVIKVAVIERHGKNGNIANGFVHGFGIQDGAIGSTVGHDSHNICIVGVSENDMAIAANRLREIEGGFIVVQKGKILAELALPIAGLMSDQSFETVRGKLINLRAAAKSLGTKLAEPFLQVAFLPLPVIPHLKISDRGMIDVDKFHLLETNNQS